MKEHKIVIIGILTIMVFGGFAIGIGNTTGHKIVTDKKPMSFGQIAKINGFKYTTHSVIRINSDSDFTSQNGVVSGNGTKDDPYIISGWDIDAHSEGDAIYIGNTTAYFVVENCYLHNATYISDPYYSGNGITLNNVIHGVVENNTLNENEWDGIELDYADDNNIFNNTCSDNGYNGIILSGSNNNVISNNICTNNSGNGIYIYSSTNNKLYGNKMVNNGISLWDDFDTFTTQEIPTNNTINGKPVYYYKNANMNNASLPTNAGQVILGNIEYLKIENLQIFNTTIGIEIGFSSNITIRNNTCSNIIEDGISLVSSNNNTISGNNCNEDGEGIYLYQSNNNTISNNNCTNNYDGIWLYTSSNNLIYNNTCTYNNDYGIYVYEASNKNIIFNNTCSNNWEGIYIENSKEDDVYNNNCSKNNDNGIYIDTSNSNMISNNNCSSNDNYGLYMGSSNNNTLLNNTCNYNGDEGIHLGFSNNNTISYNNCSINGNTGIHLEDSNNNTIFYNNCNRNTNYYGLYLYESRDNRVSNNTCSDNGYDGISLSYANGNELSSNNCTDNWDIGIYMEYSNRNTLSNNTCNDNRLGVYMQYSNNNTIFRNVLTNNSYYGICIDNGSYNSIYQNSLFYNHGSGDSHNYSHIQACDDGLNNSWNSTNGIGNYWYDWANNNNTNDHNHDGIVDWPYSIDGSAEAKDYYPLKNSSLSGVLSHPLSLQAVSGVGFVNLTWKPPTYGNSTVTQYKIYRNSTLIATVPATQLWYNDTNVSNGVTYTYSVTAVNSFGESAPSNEIQVKPSDTVPEFSSSLAISILPIVIIAIFTAKRKILQF